MDDSAKTIAQLQDELRILRQRNIELEAANAEHTQITDALHMSEARFRLLVEQSPLSTQILAPDGSTIQVNRAWEALWGVTIEHIRDYNILHDPQLVAKGIMPYIQRGFAGEALAIPPILYNPDETLPHPAQNADPRRWVRAFIYPVTDQAGRLREVVLIHEDITARHEADESLRQSEARYRTLFENFPNGSVFLFDQDLRYTVASGVGLAASGMSPDMFEGKTIWEIFPPEIARRDEPILRAALRGEATRVEVPFGASTFLVHTLPVKDERDQIVGGMVMTQDITDRKRAEEHLRFLAEASVILGASFDSDATLQNIARLAVPLLGDVCLVFIVGADGMIQRRAAAHVDPAQDEHLRTQHKDCLVDPAGSHPIARAIRSGQHVSDAPASEHSLQDAESSWSAGALLPRTHVIMPLAAHGLVLGAIMFGRSDPDRVYTEVELQLTAELARRAAQAVEQSRLYREAQEALRTRDEFMSIAAHELKTPLTTLSGSADMLLRRATRAQPYTLTERDQRMLGVIVQQSARLQQQIDTLLDVSQIRAGRLSLELRPMDVCPLVARIVDEVQPTLDRHQVLFTCERSSLIVQGDERRLEQVLQNLLQNAVKYSPTGGMITVHVARRGTEVAIAVADQGIGIPLEAQTNLFVRFYRAPNAASLGIPGLGIGLAVVTDIVARHGGRVEVSSVEGHGSTFTVVLPEYHDGADRDPGAIVT